jgi:cell division transport system permease protein
MVLFYIKEALKSIARAKLSFMLSLISMSISVLLITASVITIQLSEQLQTDLRNQISINIFLTENLPQDSIDQINTSIREMNFFSAVEFIDKEKAAEIFIKETGEDFRKLLDYNPLPVSFTVTLREKYANKDSLNFISQKLSRLNGVDEVIYQQEYINKFIAFIDNLKEYVFVITGILLIISIYIIYSTVRLVTNLRMEELETMKLVGAKLSTIKFPIIFNGILIGFFASIISLVIFILFIYYFDNYIGVQKFLTFNSYFYLIIILSVGPLAGLLVSIFSLRKITLKI